MGLRPNEKCGRFGPSRRPAASASASASAALAPSAALFRFLLLGARLLARTQRRRFKCNQRRRIAMQLTFGSLSRSLAGARIWSPILARPKWAIFFNSTTLGLAPASQPPGRSAGQRAAQSLGAR